MEHWAMSFSTGQSCEISLWNLYEKTGTVKGYHDVNFIRPKDMCQTFPAHTISICLAYVDQS